MIASRMGYGPIRNMLPCFVESKTLYVHTVDWLVPETDGFNNAFIEDKNIYIIKNVPRQ